MPATVSGIIDLVRTRTNHTGLSDAQTLDIINNGMRRLQREAEFDFAEAKATGTIATSTASVQQWTFPTDLKAPFHFYNMVSGENQEVYYSPFFDALLEFAGATTATEPSRYSFFGTVGYLFPPLQSAITYEFYYSKLLPDFTSNTGSNSLLSRAPEALEYVGVAEYYDGLEERDQANHYRKKAADSIKSLINMNRWRLTSARSAVPVTVGTILGGRR